MGVNIEACHISSKMRSAFSFIDIMSIMKFVWSFLFEKIERVPYCTMKLCKFQNNIVSQTHHWIDICLNYDIFILPLLECYKVQV